MLALWTIIVGPPVVDFVPLIMIADEVPEDVAVKVNLPAVKI